MGKAFQVPAMQLPADTDITGRGFGQEEIDLLKQVIESGTLNCTKGTQVKLLEKEFAATYGVPYCRAITSGTAAIHTAVAAIDPEPGDEIISSPITDMGAITPILYQQAIPIFADVDPVTLNPTAETIRQRITPRTRAIVVTHLFGLPADMDDIMKLAAERNIAVIEDCAQSYLAQYKGRLLGTIGDIGAFSLQQGKHMTTGEGGMVICSDQAKGRRMTLFSDKAWGYGDAKPDHYFLALNYRMTELQGAVARAQLVKLAGVVERRQATANQMTAQLQGVPGLTLPVPPEGSTHVYWKYPLIVDPNVIPGGSDALGKALKERGIMCAPRYIQKPAFECEVLAKQNTYGKSRCPYSCREKADGTCITYDRAEYPGTMQGLERVVVLPWNEKYTTEHVNYISSAVQSAVEMLTKQ
ncbi:MAG: DegT/DnrJ/EryC1/StrS family aminotransferase [Bryobacterales bacterium]|nr:DegT/DnrJ/EryC1/StrS family aminotransferase [Bryobacterales bacterium]